MNLTILAVRWDEISGPLIVSLYPHSALNDPESVALQVYLASVTVFGQHGHSQRTEFSVPLLSLGYGINARVAFDSWVDTSIRGKERPFFLAFLTDQSTGEILNFHLNSFIFEYLDILKNEKGDFSAKAVWDKIVNSINMHTKKDRIKEISFKVDSDYSIPRALHDLENAQNAWEKLKDRNQLWIALRVANRLENVDDKAAGQAFALVGQIFITRNSYQEATEAFEKATNCYVRIQLFEKAGEASYLAGKSAYHLQKYEKAIILIQAAKVWIKDSTLKASLNYDMGIVLHEQQRYDEANMCFEKSVELAKEVNNQIAAEYSSTFASRLMLQAEKEKEKNLAYSFGLIRKSAEHREEAAKLFQQTENNSHKAATSLILAVSAYFSLKNVDKGVNLLERASDLFVDNGDYISAGRSLYDGARMVKDRQQSYELFCRAENLLKEQRNNTKEKRLLGLISFEKGKLEEQLNQLTKALDSYSFSLRYMTDANAPIQDLIPVHIQSANTLFKIEDFEKAAEQFLIGTNKLSRLPSAENISKQKKKTLMNALISYRRASTAYHNAGIIALKEHEEKRAIELFVHSISLLINWVENNTKDNQDEVKKVLNTRISKLSLKKEFLLLAESKYKLDSMIKTLKMTLQTLSNSKDAE